MCTGVLPLILLQETLLLWLQINKMKKILTNLTYIIRQLNPCILKICLS